MKIDLYTLCWNEMDILPFCIDYWKRISDDIHVYVADNGSDDGSVEYLKSFPWITVKHYDSDGISDMFYMNYKNNVWKKSDADFVIVCDCDESLFSNKMAEELQYMKDNGYTILKNTWFNMCGDEYPKYCNGKLLHELVKKGVEVNGKVTLFDPKAIKEINYSPGAHRCEPEGDVKEYESKYIYTMHSNKGFGADYRIKRYKKMSERLSKQNIEEGWGYHYSFPDERIREDYAKEQESAVDLTILP